MTRSPSLKTKLDRLFIEDQAVTEITEILGRATSLARFDSKQELRDHLCEGALVNINKIASKALSIPCGEYMVWTMDAGHTMLVPTPAKDKEVFESTGKSFELHTPSLIAAYNSVERVLAEELPPEFEAQQGGGEEAEKRREAEPQRTRAGEFRSKVDPAAIDRHPLLRAMEQRNLSVTELASAVGVDPPAISRLLREPKDVQGDPGGRNPSIGLASELARVLRTDVEALFPDIFGGGRRLEPRQTTGSHSGGKGGVTSKRQRARGKWTQGSPPGGATESRKRNGKVLREWGEGGNISTCTRCGRDFDTSAGIPGDDPDLFDIKGIRSASDPVPGGVVDLDDKNICSLCSDEGWPDEYDQYQIDKMRDSQLARPESDEQLEGSWDYGFDEGVDPELVAVLLELNEREIDRDPDPRRQKPSTPGGGVNSALGKVATGVQSFGGSTAFTNSDVLAHQLGLNRIELEIVLKLKIFNRDQGRLVFDQDRFNQIYRQVYKSNPPSFDINQGEPKYPAPPPPPGKSNRPGLAPASAYAPR